MATITLHAGTRYTVGHPVVTLGDASPDDPARSILVQVDWDYPGVASTFGWYIGDVPQGAYLLCTHDETDGTITCPACGTPAGTFIEAAADWIADHDGATADDPGYFHE